MNDFQSRISRATKTVLGDVVFNLLMIFAFLFIVLPHNPKMNEHETLEAKAAGDMMIEIHWPDKIDVDIDLWAKSPDDDRPVGYSNRSGKTLNLLRDDLGNMNDNTDRNYEIMIARGLPDGEYAVNLSYYQNRERAGMEIPVDVTISAMGKSGEQSPAIMKPIIARTATLRILGEEITVVRFTLRDGELDASSVNDFFEELRTWQQSTE